MNLLENFNFNSNYTTNSTNANKNLTVEETETTENTIEDEKTPTSAGDAEVEAGNNDGSVIPVVVTLTGLLAVLMIAVYLLKTGKIKLKK